jgi:hypothetical protein
VSTYLLVAVIAGSAAATVRALVPVYRDRLRWDFYRDVYHRGGLRDLKAAAKALENPDDADPSECCLTHPRCITHMGMVNTSGRYDRH